MENNVVKISTEEYNNLRDFKSSIERDDTIHVRNNMYDIRAEQYITKDEATKDLLKEVIELKKIISNQGDQIYLLKNPQPKEITLDDVECMSLWQFWKWKNNDGNGGLLKQTNKL